MAVRTIVLALALLLAGDASAQTSQQWNPTGLQMSRAELQVLLERYEETATAASSGALREQARNEAALIRARLESGDLRVGDRVLLEVEQHAELTDTFAVVAGRRLVLPQIGEVPLEGVLRSELQDHMSAAVSRFLRNPIVRARSLIRVEILGAVGQAGFYWLPADMIISEAVMVAGGPGGNARLERMRVERAGEVIWPGERLREAVIEGRTLDQLSLRAGDSIVVPIDQPRFGWLRDGLVVLSTIASLGLLATRIF